MVDELRKKHIPFSYLTFEREGHGFYRAINIHRALEVELSLYGQVFGFRPADEIELVEVENFGKENVKMLNTTF